MIKLKETEQDNQDSLTLQEPGKNDMATLKEQPGHLATLQEQPANLATLQQQPANLPSIHSIKCASLEPNQTALSQLSQISASPILELGRIFFSFRVRSFKQGNILFPKKKDILRPYFHCTLTTIDKDFGTISFYLM